MPCSRGRRSPASRVRRSMSPSSPTRFRCAPRQKVSPNSQSSPLPLCEVQRHPVSGKVLHADFYEVDLAERLTVSVPLRFVGKPAGVVAGGILQPILREIQVECLPTEIPEFIEVNVAALGIHEAVHLSELQLPERARA